MPLGIQKGMATSGLGRIHEISKGNNKIVQGEGKGFMIVKTMMKKHGTVKERQKGV